MTDETANGTNRSIRHDLLELAAAYAEYSVIVSTAELDLPGPQILYVNSAFTRMTGYSVSELLGKTPRILQGPKTDRKVLRQLRETLLAGDDFIGRAINYKRDGTPFLLEWIISHLRDSEGRTTHYIALQRDITGKERAEAELSRFDEELRRASRQLEGTVNSMEAAELNDLEHKTFSALGEMAAGVVHDIGNALAPVRNYLDILYSIQDLPPEAAACLTGLEASTQHAIQVLANLNQFYLKNDVCRRFSINLKTIIERLPILTKPHLQGRHPQSSSGIDFQFDLGNVRRVSVNETEVVQVFVNLILNAIDAMPQGGTISVQLTDEDHCCVVRIADSGIGMSPDLMKRCFDSYVTTRETGTGLGLSICRRIVDSHGGSIEVAANSPTGTIFTVRFPVADDSTFKGDSSAVHRKLRILHVDDDTPRERLLSERLRHAGHTVDIAGSGDEGLSLFFTTRYDLVIAGADMFPTSGYDVAQTVKRTTQEIPVVIIEGASTSTSPKNLAMHLQPDAVMQAPFSNDELQQTLLELGPCSRHPAEQPGL